MKKTFAAIFSFSVFLLTAQKVQAQKTSFLVYGGPNLSTMYSASKGAGNFKSVLGFDFGFAAQFAWKDDFYFQPGIRFGTKGAKLPSGIKVKTVYTEIPINVVYMQPFGEGSFIGGAGPYFAFGSGGSITKTSGRSLDVIYKSNISVAEDTSGNVYLKRFDAGVNLMLGYELKSRLQFFLNVQWGILNIAPRVDGKNPDIRLRNIEPAFSVGYRF